MHQQQSLFLSVYVHDISLAGRKQNLNPVLKKMMKLVDATSFLDHVYLECTQCKCKLNKSIVDKDRKMFEQRISVGATEKAPGWEISHENRHWVLRHGRSCEENALNGIANWRLKQLSNYVRPLLHGLTTITSKRKKWKRCEICPKVCSLIVLKCSCIARIGGPGILWSVIKLARAVTKRTRVCDRRLARLIYYIHNTSGKHSTALSIGIVPRLRLCSGP